jgi:hypothetical protein
VLNSNIPSRHRLNKLKKITYIFKQGTRHDIDSGTLRSHTHTNLHTSARAHATIGFMVDYVCKLCYGPFVMMKSRVSTGNSGLRLER